MAQIDGTSGADTLVGGIDPDQISGSGGNDIIAGLAGDDTLTGGDGYDLITAGGGDDSIDGGTGVDILALTGQLGDYTVEEITAPTNSTPGTYRITDQRADAPEGTDTFTGIEKLRFEIGGEVSLADALDRAPTDIRLLFVSATGPAVSETARPRAMVAVLSGVDPDPGEQFTYTLINDAGGRFAIEDDLLVVRANNFDFDINASHTVTVRVTDGALNTFDRQVTVKVLNDVGPVGSVSAVLPNGATDAHLWELDDGGFTITWRGTVNGVDGFFSRRVDDTGAPVNPQAPDLMLMAAAATAGHLPPRLLGVDDDGIAAFVSEGAGINSSDNINWISALTGNQIRTNTIQESGTVGATGSFALATGYFFDSDGYVVYELTTGTNLTSFGGNTSSSILNSQTTLFFEKSSTQGGGQISQFSATRSYLGVTTFADGNFRTDEFGQGTQLSGRMLDITESGEVIYQEASSTSTSQGGSNFGTYDDQAVPSSFSFTHNTYLKGSIATLNLGVAQSQNPSDASTLVDALSIRSAAMLDTGRFAYLGSSHDGGNLFFIKDGLTSQVGQIFNASSAIQALGNDRYLLTSPDASTGTTHAQVFDDIGNPLTNVLSFPGTPQFVVRDDGSFVAFPTLISIDPQQPGLAHDGQSLVLPAVSVEADGGVFADNDGDGDLDFSGTILIGMQGGLQSLRLENGVYEMTDATIMVTNATVFADIGEDTTTPLFKGSFTLDCATGIASGFSTTPLGAGIEPLKIAGLTTIYRGLTVRKDGAAFTASFQLPTLLFDGGPMFDLNSPNALLINATGPELEGFEIPIGALDVDWFGLFEAEGKNLKVRYDGAQNELAFSGELKVTSDIIDGLGGLTGIDEVQLTFKGLKVKDGKIDFEGELSAKEWELGPITLKDVNLAIKIDDDVVVSVGVAAGVELPFEQLTGLSFAGEVLNPPLSLNKLALTAKTEVRLPHGFFLDAIGATLDHLAGSPPEPTPVPTSFTGLLGIGWGPKVPSIELPEALGIEEIEAARLVNIELTATTEWTTSIAGAGKINLYKDGLGKHDGSITWNFQQSSFTFAGSFDYLSGIITGAASARFSELGFTVNGTGTIALPNASLFGPLAGLKLGSVSILAQALADSNPTNDVVAGWGTVSIPIIGLQTVGIKLNLNDGNVRLILGANDVPETSSFDVLGTEDWLMISAAWDNLVAGPVLTQVRTPDGTFIQEADYAANGITIIDLYTGPTKKTIVIDDPRAGNWDLQIIDPSGLQNVDYSGFTPNQAVDITVGDVDLFLGATTGRVNASLLGSDPGTDVTFFADIDDTGLDGFALGAATRDADGVFTFDFGALTLAGGVYHMYAVADDGVNAPDADYGGTFVVAHRPTDIALVPNTAPIAAAAALVLETALPGTEIAALGAISPDIAETHSFSLVNDAGGRFAIVGDELVVGTGAPFDAASSSSHQIVIRATTSHGLTFDETVSIEIGDDEGSPFVLGVERDVLIGTGGRDVFFNVSGGKTVIGLGDEDLLYLNGNRSDFAIIFDPTGAIAGPVHVLPSQASQDLPPNSLPPNLRDPDPPYVLLNDLRDAAGPIVTSGIEFLQFRDARIPLAAALNTAPDAAVDGPYAVAEDTVLIVDAVDGLLANDTDTESDPLTAVLVTGPAHGGLTLNPDGSFTYTPDANYFGPDSFTYKADDGLAEGNAATVNLAVTALNDGPTSSALRSVTTDEDTASAAMAIGAMDVDGDLLTYSVRNGFEPTKGSVNFSAGSFTYTPNTNANGSDGFDILISDGHGGTAEQAVLITINPLNDAPIIAGAVALGASAEDAPINGTVPAATDIDSASFTYSLVTQAAHGSAVVNADGTFTYTPHADYNGPDSFTFKANDGAADSNTAMISLTVGASNDAPVIGGDGAVTVAEGGSVVVATADLTATDPDNTDGQLVFTMTGTSHGIVRRNGSAATTFTKADLIASIVTFQHDGGEADGSFAVSLSDGAASPVLATITIIVNPHGNDAPVVSAPVTLAAIDEESGTRVITQAELLANASDVDGPSLTAINLQISAGLGALVNHANQTWSYTPAANDDTSVTFSYQVTDGTGSVATSASLDIVPAPQAPGIPITNGTSGPDSFTAPTGDHQFNGFGSADTITFNFFLVDATVSYAGNKIIVDSASGHTILTGFEKFVFTDGAVDNNDGDWLVDDLFYYAKNHDVWNAKAEADQHYHQFGWKEGRDPAAFFDTSLYLASNPDVKAVGIDPLLHFDQYGWKEGRVSSLEFGTQQYLDANPDVAAAQIDPLWHFLAVGGSEGRLPLAPTELVTANGFDFVHYLANNSDVAAAGVDPFWHFQNTGWKEGRNPNALFDTSGYLATYADVAAADINPLDHYNTHGWHEGRDPSVSFDTTSYLAANQDVAAANVNPLVHFLRFGSHEGRSPQADGLWG
jgi:VCBS repeat-containing protein